MAAEILLVASAADIAGIALNAPLWLFWAVGVLYLLLLTLGAALNRRRSRPEPASQRRICILIPAHNEEMNLGAVVDGLHALNYPAQRYQIIVIADNCTDRTAEIGRTHGAEVLERTDATQRGKGYALDWALNRLLPDPRRFDAFLILDADSVLSSNFLSVMNAAMEQGHGVVQGRYDVLNVQEGWRTRLMTCALALAHYVKPLGRNTFGLSDGLKGNGMCFSRAVMERVPWSGESITEDIEYTLRLVLEGIRIEFAPEAVVRAQMPTGGKQAATQRQRWEGGRYGLIKRAFALLLRGMRMRRIMVIDRAVELIIPPFVEFFTLPALGLLIGGLWLWIAPESAGARWMLWGWGGILTAQAAYLVIGLALARVPLSVASSLLFAPFYILWKFGLYGAMLVRRGAGGWQRTERHTLEVGGNKRD
jgi:cellulose synthase/poly-beta-1,6-N-acetylglucosamine synthase-like glycosyltransferase